MYTHNQILSFTIGNLVGLYRVFLLMFQDMIVLVFMHFQLNEGRIQRGAGEGVTFLPYPRTPPPPLNLIKGVYYPM